MTAIMIRPDVPEILPAKHARPPLRQTLAAGLRHADRPWSIGIDLLLCGVLIGLVGWEGFYEFPSDFELPHLVAAIGAFIALALHAFRAFADSPDRSENHR